MSNRLRLPSSCQLFILSCFFTCFSYHLSAQNTAISIGGPNIVCQYDCAVYSATVTPGSTQSTEVLWDVNGMTALSNSGLTFVFCPAELNVPPGQANITATFFGENGIIARDSLSVLVIPFQPLEIKSSNTAPCNDIDSSACEKVCPGATVTYSILPNTPSGQGIFNWHVVGADSWTLNPSGGNPNFGSSITVTWGPTGTGSVAVFTDGIFGCAGEAALCVTIIAIPEAAFTTNPLPASAGNLTVCKNQTVYFQNLSNGADSYEWRFSDDLSTSAETSPQHTFLTAGTYTVSLIAFSDCLCSDTTQMTIEVLDAASPTLDCVGTVCPGEAITYTASNGCQPFAWAVSGNGAILGGGTANSDTISILWNNGPTGTITLGSQPCSGMLCPIPAILEVPIISNNTEIEGRERVCPASTSVYSIEPFGGTSFVWSLASGGSIVDGQGTNQVTVQWNDAPNQAVSHWLSVTYENCYLGCGGQDSIAVHILSPFVINGPVEACVNGSVMLMSKLTANNQNLNTNWTLFDPAGNAAWSISNTASAMPPFLNGDGKYRILAVPSNPAQTCSDEQEWGVQVSPLPNVPGSIAGERNICPGSTYTYEAQGIAPNENVRWTLVNGVGAAQTLFGNPVNISWAAAGPYQLAAATISTNGLNCSSDTIRIDPVLIGIPAITGTLAACEDALGSYSIIPQNIDIQWTISPSGAGAVAEGQGSNAADIFWTQAGNHTVNVAVCGQSAAFPVTVWANPDPVVQHPAGLCPGATGVIQTSVPYNSYRWKDEDGALLSIAAMPNLSAGTFAVEVSDINGCFGTSEFTMASYDAPNVSLTTADPTGFCNNAGSVLLTALTDADANYTYQWFQDANPIAGATLVEHTTNQYGLYTVQATNAYGCTSVAGPINIFNYCGGGGGGFGAPGGGALCPAGVFDITFDPNVRCDSFQFHLIDNVGQYVPGSANWLFFISGGSVLGSATGDNPSFVFDNAGKYKVFALAQLQDGSSCLVLGSAEVETVARFDHEVDCPGSITDFEDVSEFLPTGGITSYAWDFGDPGSGASNMDNIANPQHNFAVSGLYQVQLTVTGSSGCTSSATLPVEVPALPDASFATPAARCAGNALLFTPANTPGDLLDVVWDFGDPTSGSANDAQGITVYHNFSIPGIYTVTATATNVYGCTATFSMPVTVSPNPLSGTISPASPGALCEGQTLTLTAPAGAASYLWSDENMTTTQTLLVGEAGVYGVTLTDANGCTFAVPAVTIQVTPAPDALIKALLKNELGQITGTSYPTLTVCSGEDVYLQAQGNGTYNYIWSGGNGVTDEAIFSEDRGNLLPVGTYMYQVTVTNPLNGCTSVTDPFTVTVNPNPGGFSIGSNVTCASTSTVLSYTGPEPANWQFIWSTGATGTTLNTEDFGGFFIRVINEFGCEAKSNTVTILPGPQVSAIPSGCHERCAPDTLCIPNIPNITSWQWYFNGNPVAGATSSNFIADENGTYYAVLSDIFGCTAQSDLLTIELTGETGDLQGNVWSDVDDNGAVGNTSDTTLAGIRVMLLQNGVPLDTTVTGPNGVFFFDDLPNGWYVVMLDSSTFAPGWRAIIGKDSTYVNGCAEGFDLLELLMRFDCVPMMSTEELSACEGGFALYNNVPVPAGLSQVFQSTDAHGCDVFVTVTVLALPVSNSMLSLYACPGSTVTYEGIALPIGATQTFPLLNYLGCDSMVTVSVLPLATSTGAATLQACPGSTATYEGVSLAIGATQDFTLVNAAGCDSVVTVTVTALPISTSSVEESVCPGETYLYEGVDIPAGQTRNFTLVNQWGCDSIVMVSVTALPETTFELLYTESCPNQSNGSLEIADPTGGTPPYEYAINESGAWQNNEVFNDLAAGTYTVQVRDAADCIFSDTIALAALPEIMFSTVPGLLPCDSAEITLAPALISGNADDLDFLWSTGDTTPSIRVTEAGTYSFSARLSSGLCPAVSGAIEVQWADLANDEALVYIPNVIKSEATDPENSAFRPRFAAGMNILKYDLIVFDRWGTQVFRSQNPSESWMGTFKGGKLRPGVWVWKLEAEISFCGRIIPIRKEGDVTLIR